MRATKFYQIALTRLAEHLKVKIVETTKHRGHVCLDLRHRLPKKSRDDEWLASGFVWCGGKKLVLAHLVQQALGPGPVGWSMEVDEVALIIKLTAVSGRDRGLKAHLWQSLNAVIS